MLTLEGTARVLNDESDDSELVDAAKRKNDGAWRILVERHTPRLSRCYYVHGLENEIEDACQDFWTKVIKDLATLKDNHKAASWGWSVAYHNRMDYQRESGTHNLSFAYDEAIGRNSICASDPITYQEKVQAFFEENQEVIAKQLPAAPRELFLTMLSEHVDCAEAAKILKRSPGWGRQNWRRLIHGLRAIFKTLDLDPPDDGRSNG